MANISASQVKELRERTGAGLMDCKRALVETDGNIDTATEVLQKKAAAKAVKRMDRAASEGTVTSYIHGQGRIGVLLELNSETDFVARNDAFQNLSREICLHIAATGAKFISREDVPEERRNKQAEIFRGQAIEEGKPEAFVGKIIDGRMDKWLAEICLNEQPWFRNSDQTVAEVMQQNIAKIGENLKIRRFVRWELGESL
jgi:elongation factor Ts